MAGKKINLEEEAVNEVLIADIRLRGGMFSDLRVAIISSGQGNHPPNSAAICVLLVARESAHCINAPDVTWACTRCLV